MPPCRRQFIAQISTDKLSLDSKTEFGEKSFTITGKYHFSGKDHLVRFVFDDDDMGGYNLRLEVESDTQTSLAISGEISREFTVLGQAMKAYLRGGFSSTDKSLQAALGSSANITLSHGDRPFGLEILTSAGLRYDATNSRAGSNARLEVVPDNRYLPFGSSYQPAFFIEGNKNDGNHTIIFGVFGYQ